MNTVHKLIPRFLGAFALAIAAALPLSSFAQTVPTWNFYDHHFSFAGYTDLNEAILDKWTSADSGDVRQVGVWIAKNFGQTYGTTIPMGIKAGSGTSNIVDSDWLNADCRVDVDISTIPIPTSSTHDVSDYYYTTVALPAGCTVSSGTQYKFVGVSNQMRLIYDNTHTHIGDDEGWMQVSGDPVPPPGDSCITGSAGSCIDSVIPANAENIATSTPATFGAAGYLDADDYKDGAKITVSFISRAGQQSAVASPSLLTTTYDFPISASGVFSESTTTIDMSQYQIGDYDMTTRVHVPYISIFGFSLWDTTVVATSTYFNLGTTTGFDLLTQGQISGTQYFLNATTTNPFESCHFDFTSLDFFSGAGAFGSQLTTCVFGLASSLVVPSTGQISDLFGSLYTQIASKAPFGYATLAIQDLTGFATTATSTISDSNLTVRFPDTGIFASPTSTSSPAGRTITFIDLDKLSSSTPDSHLQSVYADLANFFNVFFGAAFLFWLWWFAVRHMKP